MLKKLKSLFTRSDPQEDISYALYQALVAQARLPVFYEQLDVPDDLDGRFEMICLHAFLLMRRFKGQDRNATELSQKVYDVMFMDMERSIREIGVSDVSIARHMKRMMSGFHGRVTAYEAALEGRAEMAEALRRNLYGTVEVPPTSISRMVDYVCRLDQKMADNGLDSLKNGTISYDRPD